MNLNVLKDLSLFLLIFGMINDNFVVERLANPNALKIIFIFFILMNFKNILASFLMPKNNVMRFFYLFISVLSVITFLDIFWGYITLIEGLQVIISISIIFVYISYYPNLERILYFVWISVIVSAIISLFNAPVDQWTFRRSGGTEDPNEFSVHLLMGLSIGFYLYQKHKNLFLLVSTTLLFLYALLYAGSKTAMLVFAILFLYTLVTRFRFIIKKFFSIPMLILILGLGVFATQYNFSKLDAVKGMEERAKKFGTAHERFISWKAGLRMFEDNTFLGVGVNKYENNVRKYALDFIAEGSLAPHNIIVKILAEVGILPSIAFFIFLYFLLTEKYYYILHSEYYWLSLVVYSTLLMGLTLSITYEKYFWMALAILSNVIISESIKSKETEYENITYNT